MTGKRILIAEDDDSSRRALERLFTARGFCVESAANYCDVKDLLDVHDFDLIVSDNGMPLSPGSTRIDRQCGLQLLAYAKLGERHHNIPFVLHTGDDTDETKRLAHEFGGIYREKLDPSMSIVDFCIQLLEKGD